MKKLLSAMSLLLALLLLATGCTGPAVPTDTTEGTLTDTPTDPSDTTEAPTEAPTEPSESDTEPEEEPAEEAAPAAAAAGADVVVIGNYFEHNPQMIPHFAKALHQS